MTFTTTNELLFAAGMTAGAFSGVGSGLTLLGGWLLRRQRFEEMQKRPTGSPKDKQGRRKPPSRKELNETAFEVILDDKIKQFC